MRNATSIGQESFTSVTEPDFLIDTNVLIYLSENSFGRLTERVETMKRGEIATSSIAFAEFARGVDWSLDYADATVERFFDAIAILPFDQVAARHYADLPFARHRFDRLIAAHALALDLTLITANPSDFHDIPRLRVEDWTR